jgi:lysozyme
MTVPVEALLLIACHEQYRQFPYKCAAGHMTVGFGHKILPGEDFSKGVTYIEAIRLLKKDAAEHLVGVIKALPLGFEPEPYQLGALLSFAFNVGVHALATSSLMKCIVAGDYGQVPGQLRRWTFGTNPKTGRKEPLGGLVKRREDEVALWLGQV